MIVSVIYLVILRRSSKIPPEVGLRVRESRESQNDNTMEINLNKLQEIVEESWTAAEWHAIVHGVAELNTP